MRSNWLTKALPVLALSLAIWGCDTLGEVTQPTLQPAGISADSDGDGEGFKVVREKDTSTSIATAIIDASGGKLIIGKHELWVPKDAVSGPTTFTMSRLDSEDIAFKLTATQVTTNDIGSQGFAVPVKLVLSYHDASEQPEDPSKLKVIWLKTDGTREAQTTDVDLTGKRAIGYLNHFSDYALAQP